MNPKSKIINGCLSRYAEMYVLTSNSLIQKIGDNYYENTLYMNQGKLVDVRCLNDHTVLVVFSTRVVKYMFDRASNRLVQLSSYDYSKSESYAFVDVFRDPSDDNILALVTENTIEKTTQKIEFIKTKGISIYVPA